LTPICVVHTNHRAFGNRRMRAQDLLNLERRHLEAAGLDDVYVRAAEQPKRTALPDRNVAGPEPAVSKRVARLVGPLPVLETHRRTAHLQLARHALSHIASVFINQSNINAGQWLTHVA